MTRGSISVPGVGMQMVFIVRSRTQICRRFSPSSLSHPVCRANSRIILKAQSPGIKETEAPQKRRGSGCCNSRRRSDNSNPFGRPTCSARPGTVTTATRTPSTPPTMTAHSNISGKSPNLRGRALQIQPAWSRRASGARRGFICAGKTSSAPSSFTLNSLPPATTARWIRSAGQRRRRWTNKGRHRRNCNRLRKIRGHAASSWLI